MKYPSLIVLIPTLLASVAQAAPVAFFDWLSGPTSDHTSFSAITSNDADEVLGEFCFVSSGKCTWELSITLQCKEGADFWILANADSAYLPLQVKCLGYNTTNSKYNYGFDDWKDAEALFKNKQNNLVGFAIPVGGTQFRVIRFSLRGVGDATSYAEQQFTAMLPSKNTAPVSDQIL
jgi:hypothetical protein